MEMKRFKMFLKEGFNPAAMQKVIGLIQKYLEARLGKLYELPGGEEFKRTNGEHGMGFRYFCQDERSFRINWIKGDNSNTISSIDVWTADDLRLPAITIDVRGQNITKILPTIVQLIKQPQEGEFTATKHGVTQESGWTADGEYITEMSQGTDPLFDAVIEFMKKKSKDGFGKGDFFRVGGSPARRIFDNILDEYPKMFKTEGSGSRMIYKFVGKESEIDSDLVAPARVKSVKGSGETIIDKNLVKFEAKAREFVPFKQQMEDIKDLVEIVCKQKLRNALWITGKGGTGKSYVVEDVVFKKWGWKDEEQYVKIKATASATKVYQLLWEFNGKTVFFDDADAIFDDQLGRNLLKGATDSSKHRKVSWEKMSSWLYNPREVDLDDPEQAERIKKEHLYPSSFEFTGQVIAISNLPIDELDPDGALRTRGYNVDVRPTDEEFIAYVETVTQSMELGTANGVNLDKQITPKMRKDAFEFVKNEVNDVNFRVVLGAMKLMASGHPKWKEITKRY